MVLPSLKANPILLIRFTPKASHELIHCVVQRLDLAGIIVVTSEGNFNFGNENSVSHPGSNVVLGITTSQSLLEHEAELVKLVKPSRTHHDHIPIMMEHFSVDARDNFLNLKDSEIFFNADLSKHIPVITKDDVDSDGLFTSADRIYLLQSILNALSVLDKEEEASDLSRVLDSMKIHYVETNPTTSLSSSKLNLPASTRKSSILMYSKNLIQVLKSSGFVDVVCPVHIPHIQKRILNEAISLKNSLPILSIRDYYGEGVAFYFAWMNFMTLWFLVPGFVGLVVFFVRMYRGETIDNCDFTPFVGIVTFFWAILCNQFWEQNEARLAYLWGTYATSYRDRLTFDQRPNFVGETRKSPVTGKMEKYYPQSKRLCKLFISSLCTIMLLSCAGVVMIISMNVQGYISREDLEQWGEIDHPLYFPWFSQLAEKGHIFDAQSIWKGFVPVILRAILVMNMNKQYRYVAEYLTEWENHETTAAHESSLILKRVLFEAFDAYIIMFYLAIYERNIHLLRLELVGAFNVDTFRRVLTECFLPYCRQKLLARRPTNSVEESKKKDNQTASSICFLSQEAEMEEYEQFDDYIEMLIQFGYVTLFASAFPLAALVAVVANSVECRTDFWKLSCIFKRPFPNRTDSVGIWKKILQVMVWISALTNCLIFVFTSSQMRQWLPSFYTTDKYGRNVLVPHTADETVLIMFTIEHLLLIIGAVLKQLVPPVPDDVIVEAERRQWLHEALAQNRLKVAKALGKIKTHMN